MKKGFVLLAFVLLVAAFLVTGYAEDGASKVLIAYFSMPEPDGVDASSGASRVVRDGEVLGNVESIARVIEERTGGELFAIETVQDYPVAHDALTAFASGEKAAGARPELSTAIEDIAQYDVIFLGYPNWWGDLPMPVYTFLESYDLGGKTVIPFCPHGGSGFSGTVETIAGLQPGAEV